ncbi:MAG: toll/interleukin-1 receptor domain-containing protein, partial [Anaerolineae bacterium]|nr:toll/interleukin-1 receptor domain-containing protein [Anaerolineae bacterium]
MQVFISYKHENDSFIKALKERIQAAGFDVWIDKDLLRVGEDWRQEIDNAIKASFCLIVVMSPGAFESPYVTYEWAYALGIGLRVLPVMVSATPMHPRMETIQYIDFTDHFSPPWDRLVARLREIADGGVSLAARPPLYVVRAVEALESLKVEDREFALDALSESSHPAALQALVEATGHHLADVRRYAALLAARQITEPRILPALREQAEAWDPEYYPDHRHEDMRIRFSRSAEAALLAGKFGDGGKAITREFLARQAQNLDDEERAQ